MKTGRRLFWKAVLALALLSLAAGCASVDQARKKDAAIAVPPPIEKPQYLFHRVVEGESLAGIAKWYAGDEMMAEQLKEANPDLAPDKLTPGEIVRVPVFLAVLHSEQPDHSTQPQKPSKTVRKKGTRARQATVPSPSPAVPQVFGPR